MGQRTLRRAKSGWGDGAETEAAQGLMLAVFPSALGWFALLGREDREAKPKLYALAFGHATDDGARQALQDRRPSLALRFGRPFDAAACEAWSESDWHPELRLRLQRFAEREPVEFDDIEVALPALTAFQSRVLAATRRLRYGETATYADLARRAGNPGAARAVGSVMASNQIPLVIPCHRVVAAGRLGGYSAPQGVELKRTLLAMEAQNEKN